MNSRPLLTSCRLGRRPRGRGRPVALTLSRVSSRLLLITLSETSPNTFLFLRKKSVSTGERQIRSHYGG